MKTEKKNYAAVFKRIFIEAKPIWGWLLLSALLNICLVVCNVISPKLLGNLIQTLYNYWTGYLITKDLPEMIARGLVPLAAAYVTVSVFGYANMYLLNNAVSRYFTCNIRVKISEKIKHLPVKYIDSTPVGEVLRRLMDDVSAMGGSIHNVIDAFFPIFLQIAAIIIVMFYENAFLAVLVLILTPLSIFLSSKISSSGRKILFQNV